MQNRRRSLANMEEDYQALRYENEKLKKINHVLMQRVEMGWGNHSDAYRSFESAVLLADKVKDRTRQLQQTLNRLEETNEQLATAQSESEQSRQLLLDAIESIPESFVLFDAARRLVLANSRFWKFWDIAPMAMEVGVTTLKDIQRTATRFGLIDEVEKSRGHIDHGTEKAPEIIFRLKNGRWMQMTEHPTADAGLVVIYTDITSIKESEELRHEQAVAEQAVILQSTLENMSQGVVLVNAENQLESWNRRFIEISGLQCEQVERGVDFHDLLAETELSESPRSEHLVTYPQAKVAHEDEITLKNGRVLLIRHHVIPGGGFLNTYADITERFKNEEALRESEQRIRLITDAMPAMISYVNHDLHYEFVNGYFEDWFERPRDEILGQHLFDVLGDRDYERHRIYIDDALKGRSVSFEIAQTRGSESRNFRKSYIPNFDSENNVVGFFALEQDITKQRQTAQALQKAYENMEQRVSARTREISQINQQLRKEIDERHVIEASLIEAKSEAESANDSKTKFLAAASHDLLQPMNAARLFAGALSELPLPKEAGQLVNSLSFSLENVESLISALVDISKLEAGLVESAPESLMIDILLQKLVDEFKPQTVKAGLGLRYVKSSASVYTDSQLLARIMRNLLTNSIRYTPKGDILVGCRRREDGLEVQVWDTGIGIPEEKIQEIFQEFCRIDAKEKRSDKGLGLGLAIVDRIVRVLGHHTRVKSRLGKGSCFSVIVPYGVFSTETKDTEFELDTFGRSIRGARVLVIDNDADICQGMRMLLSGWGCEVKTVQALEEFADDSEIFYPQPDLVIADYHLDDNKTGIDAIEIINSRLSAPLPVVLITANYTNELRQLAKDKGYALLNKPIKPLKLKAVMANILSESACRSSGEDTD